MRLRHVILIVAATAAAAVAGTWLFETGYIRFNYPSRVHFPVRGIDVSHHQGDIDWEALTTTDVSFAYIKATEGADHRDTRFRRNWQAVGRTTIRRGAYHYFTFCTPGMAQAENFRAVVPAGDAMLPPVVDVEFIGNCRSWSDIATIRTWLSELLADIESTYGRKPILYVTERSYERIVQGSFPGYRLWVRDTFHGPRLPDDTPWTFWQYADRGHLPGIRGFVDLNVFAGTRQEFEALWGQPADGTSAGVADAGANGGKPTSPQSRTP